MTLLFIFLWCQFNMTDEWWRYFGGSTPNVKKLAIQLLSQTSSSSGCERNWNVFERIHSKNRNRMEHKRLNDLVFIHYNFRLKNRYIFLMLHYIVCSCTLYCFKK